MDMFWPFLGIAAFTGGLLTLIVFTAWPASRRLLLWLVLTAGFFGFMLLLEKTAGRPAAWNIFALVFIGLSAWHSQKILQKTFWRDPEDWDGHAPQNPEEEAFSDALKVTINHVTGLRNGLVLSGPFDERYLADLGEADLDALAADLAARDPRGVTLLESYRDWRRNAAS
ncbi:MAG: hypothetical protein U1F24_09805 [Alphaproteobacteria bacterium]